MARMVLLNDGQFEAAEPFGNITEQQETVRSAIKLAIDSNKPLVIHFHGGLVNRKNGITIADNLYPKYEDAGGVPLFFVWQTGFIETIKTNYKDAFKGRFVQWAIKKLTSRVKSKLSDKLDGDLFRSGVATSDDEFTEAELQSLKNDIEKSTDFNTIIKGLNAAVSKSFKDDIPEDGNVFRSAISNKTDNDVDESMLIETSCMDPTLFVDEGSQENTRGLISAAALKVKLIKAIIATAKGVISRYRRNTDHGLHATIMEELSRRIHGDHIGSAVWGMMKKDSADAFFDGNAGDFLLRTLENYENPPRVLLVGHSAGAIFVCNLLRNSTSGAFDVALLAPAVSYKYFNETVNGQSDRIGNFRIYTMTDENERKDALINGAKFIYPSSLLYLISGILEADSDKRPDIDCPILGMQRFYDTNYNARPHDDNLLSDVRQYLDSFTNGIVWSKSDAGLGLATTAIDHGAFDNNDQTVASLQHLIKNGF
tara:strand:- start:2797 stop:4245 length:1449 start_codon:yes stop_codon:yes gene_type:complete